MFVSVDARLQRVPAVAREVEDQHPAAAQPELALAAEVLHHRVDDPGTQEEERHADDLLEDRIDPIRQDRAERQRQDAQQQDDRRVAQRVERCESDRVALLVGETRLSERVRRTRSTRSVLVHVRSHLAGVVTVRRHGRPGGHVDLRVAGRGGARDVGDRGDVIPVEAVPKAERDHAEQQDDDAEIHARSLPSEQAYRKQPQ
jgi:hypothetical protein